MYGVCVDFCYNKSKRLLTAIDYKQVFDNPIKKIHSTHFLLIVAQQKKTTPRLGLAITKKKIKNATDRNQIKRHTKEYFRHAQHNITGDMVLIVKSKLPVLTKVQKSALLKNELQIIFDKLKK